ncbi:hypothetical protein ABIB40_000350 [Pedobacter sp. UYP30]|uniref:hypothetical protein n=1 Tax=Pedobacter sp. UYP30 TaxID=1756400 RepID=UPI0033924A99
MAFESLTDDKIADLLNCKKRLKNPQSRSKNKEGHEQVNFKVIALDNSGHEFEIYKRQNLRDEMEDDFSCGISWLAPNGETLTLKRYNGPNHNHPNHLEKIKLGYTCHIHIATEKYIKANRKAEGFAMATDKYTTIEGALHCLVTDCNVSGISTTSDNKSQTKLFDNEF